MSPLQHLERALTVTSPAGAISEALHAAGVTTRKAQAVLLGEHAQHWTRYLNGGRSPSTAKVAKWLAAADAAGHPIRLEWGANGACVASSVPERDGA